MGVVIQIPGLQNQLYFENKTMNEFDFLHAGTNLGTKEIIFKKIMTKWAWSFKF